MKKTLKASLIVAAAFAFGCAAVACGEDDDKKKPNEPTKYTVAYELGTGVTGTAPAGGKYAAGAKFDVAALPAGITNGELVFGGWNDGTNVYQAGAEYTMPAHDVTFTAKWDENTQTVTYTVTYNLNGGTGTAPTESDKAAGATFKIAPSTGITKDGFDFVGWSDGKTVYKVGADFTMPASNVTFDAQWTETLVTPPALTQTVEFSGSCVLPTQNAGIGNPDTDGQLTEGGETVVGIKIDGTSNKAYFKLSGDAAYTESRACTDESDSKYRPVGGINGVDKDGNDLPTKGYGADAYYFEIQIGKDGNRHYCVLVKSDLSKLYICNTDDEPLANGEFTKVQSVDPGNDEVTVTFDLGYSGFGVENPAAQTIAKGGKLTAVAPPTRTGYTFGGWRIGTADGTAFDIANDVVNESMTLVAVWTANAETYTATFIGGRDVTGTLPSPVEMSSTTKFPAGSELVKGGEDSGFTFIGWMDIARSDDPDNATYGKVYSAGAMMNFGGNRTFKAVFGKTYTSASGSYYDPDYLVRDDGFLISDPNGDYSETYAYTTDGEIFTYDTGYYEISFKVDEETGKYSNYDGWDVYDITADDGSTKLVFDGCGAVTFGDNTGTYEALGGTLNLTFGSDSVSLEYDPNNVDTTMFGKFTLNGTTYTFGNPINVTFSLGEGVDGTAPDAQIVRPNGKAKEPTAPTREGYLFKAWHVGSVDGTVFDFDTAITSDTTLVAEWAVPVTVTFSLGEGVEGTAPAAQKVLPGGTATAPKAPTRTGYIFKAWRLASVDGEVFDFATVVDSDITLVAEWEVKVMGALLYDYAGEGAKVTYGYASVDEAGTNTLTFPYTFNGTTTDRVFYCATATYTSGTASTPYKLTISIIYKSTLGLSTTKIYVDGDKVDVKDNTLKNQEVVVVGAASYGSPEVKVNFSMVNGKRTMTLSCGDQTVTWTEVTPTSAT